MLLEWVEEEVVEEFWWRNFFEDGYIGERKGMRKVSGRSDGKVLGIQSERKWIVGKKLSKDNRCWNERLERTLKAHLWGVYLDATEFFLPKILFLS
jgi:hypothetical protein